MKIRNIVLGCVVGVAVVATVASGSSNTATSGESGDASAAASAPTTFKVGEPVTLGDDTLVVNSVQIPYPSTNELSQPAAGNQFVAADVSVTNNGSDPSTVSSLVCFTLRDSTGQSFNQTIVAGAPPAPDGAVAPGQSIRGTLTYEVPTTATGLSLIYQCDPLSTGSATIALQ